MSFPQQETVRHAELFLVGGLKKTISKNMHVKGKNDIPYILENKTCLTPPTRYYNWD
jgi:hypothetical protein